MAFIISIYLRLSGEQDSNLQPYAPKANTLPIKLPPVITLIPTPQTGLMGLEPTTFGLTNQYSTIELQPLIFFKL